MLIMFSAFGSIVNAAVSMAECSVITVRYHERVPYIQTTPNGVGGPYRDSGSFGFQKGRNSFHLEKNSV